MPNVDYPATRTDSLGREQPTSHAPRYPEQEGVDRLARARDAGRGGRGEKDPYRGNDPAHVASRDVDAPIPLPEPRGCP
jgi:hypothetical protein